MKVVTCLTTFEIVAWIILFIMGEALVALIVTVLVRGRKP